MKTGSVVEATEASSKVFCPPVAPEGWDRCHSYQNRKSRFCRVRPLPGSKYCGTHKDEDAALAGKVGLGKGKVNDRIPCPVDPTHTISKHSVDSHIKKCPKVKQQRELEGRDYYRKGCNRGDGIREDEKWKVKEDGYDDCWELDGDRGAIHLAKCIVKAYGSVFPNDIPTEDLSGPEFKGGFIDELRSRMVPLGTNKHIVQQASMVGHMRRVGMLPGLGKKSLEGGRNNNDIVVEMGAGRGMLGFVTAGVAAAGVGEEGALLCQEITTTGENTTGEKRKRGTGGGVELCMVERGGTKRKADTRVRNDVVNTNHEKRKVEGKRFLFNSKDIRSKRIRCDLEHVWMQTVVEGMENKGGIMVVAKHLCGAGTDLALRGVGGLEGEERKRVNGIAFATCCHGVCNLGMLVGRDWLGEKLKGAGWEGGLGEKEFKLLCKWTGASTSEDGNRKGEDDEEEDEHGNSGVKEEGYSRLGAGALCTDPSIEFTKQQLGRLSQRLIDQCRCEWVRKEFGFDDTKVVYYVGQDVTPQNAIIIGTKGGEGGRGGSNKSKV